MMAAFSVAVRCRLIRPAAAAPRLSASTIRELSVLLFLMLVNVLSLGIMTQPELAKLQKDLGGADFQVVELSQDLKGYEASAKFLKEVGADNLTLYSDDKGLALDALKGPGLPITLLLNRDGKEVGRLIGPAPWAGDEAKAIIDNVIKGK